MPTIGTRFGTQGLSIGPHRGRSTTTAEFPAPTGSLRRLSACHLWPLRHLRCPRLAPPQTPQGLLSLGLPSELLRTQPHRGLRPPREQPERAPRRLRIHHPQPAPHRGGPPRQPLRPPQTAPPAQLALAAHLHHRPGTHPQPAPTHLSRQPGPAQPTSTPSATNPHQPHTLTAHTPKRPRPTPATNPAPTNPTQAPLCSDSGIVSGFGWLIMQRRCGSMAL